MLIEGLTARLEQDINPKIYNLRSKIQKTEEWKLESLSNKVRRNPSFSLSLS